MDAENIGQDEVLAGLQIVRELSSVEKFFDSKFFVLFDASIVYIGIISIVYIGIFL